MNWMRFRPLYLLISGAVIAVSLYAISTWWFKPSIDFTGGTVVEYEFPGPVELENVKTAILQKQNDFEIKDAASLGEKNVQFRFGPDFTEEHARTIELSLGESLDEKPELVRFETVGPTLSSEILKKTYVAIAIASIGILLWIAWQFKSLKFGVSAILAMLHDTIILLGTFALLGHFVAVEVDILFVTAMLTILSFSVHDTIVVYDRIRETSKRSSGLPMIDIANRAVTETMVRSLNNSLTIIFMLVALFLMGGVTIKWFVFALLVLTITGTYSSPFVAVPLVVTWEELRKKMKR